MARSLSTQDVTWFLDLNEKGQLDLEPPYQRRSVWTPKDRRYFIDTVLNDYPAPPVFLHKTIDEKGKPTYHVVDGKQRLETIIRFTENKVRIPDDFSVTALQGKRWKDLQRDTREKFWNYTIIVEMLPDTGEAALRSTFDRINRNSKKLSPQEMRHAKYDGWFTTFAETEADKPEWRELGLASTARAKRMLDVQFVSELMMILLKGKVSGFDQNALDNIYAEYDDPTELADFSDDAFVERFDKIKRYIADCLKAVPDLKEYLRVQLHLYSLWAYVKMRNDFALPPAYFAPRYKQFLDDVATFNAQNAHAQDRALTEEYKKAVEKYASAAKGASTDEVQRVSRVAALTEALQIAGAAGNEGQ